MEQDGFDQDKSLDVWLNSNTDRLEILDGHHRAQAAIKAGLTKVSVRI